MYVYRHRRTDNNKIFYIGIGSFRNYARAKSKTGRNNIWNKITNKTDYTIEIIGDNLTKEEACELEMLLIKEYGRINLNNGILCNLTDGGESNAGKIVSEETRLKLKAAHSKRIYRKMHTEEYKLKLSKNSIGNTYGSKKIIDTSTNKIYNSIKEVSKEFNLHPETISRYLRGTRKNKTNLQYYKL